MTCHILANAIAQNLNVIVSAPRGMGIVTSTLEELSQVGRRTISLNPYSVRLDLTAALNEQTEVIVFDGLDQANYELSAAAAELMRSRSLGGLKLPNLKSVVGFFGRATDERDVLAESYAALGPALSMDWR